MNRKPKVEFGSEAVVIELDFGSGLEKTSEHGVYWMWGVKVDGQEHMLFANPDQQGAINACGPHAGQQIAMQKTQIAGSKAAKWKTWTMEDGAWQETAPSKPAEGAAPTEQVAGPQAAPPPISTAGPASAPPASQGVAPAGSPPAVKTPQKAVQGLSAHEALAIYADLMPRCLQILFGHAQTDDIGETEQARMLATSIFIGITNDRSSTPKGYQAAPSAVSQVTQAIDGEPPPPSDADVPVSIEDGDLPF